MSCSIRWIGALCAMVASLAADPARGQFDFVRIAFENNPSDTRVMNDGSTAVGAVPYEYEIGRFEISNVQYLEFLNAVAQWGDPNGLWDPGMPIKTTGVVPTGYYIEPGSGAQNKPVAFVSFYDAIRFVNWLQNGKPGGVVQDAASTEDGAYTITPGTIPERNPYALYFLPNEDEWYKAAYYDAEREAYFFYPTGSDSEPSCGSANCNSQIGETREVHNGPASPSGTVYQGGNVREWTERSFFDSVVQRRGGDWFGSVERLRASYNDDADTPSFSEDARTGFRIARRVPTVERVDFSLVPIGSAGNGADASGVGSVPYNYRIGKYEVTNAQYASFLNAVATESDPNDLFPAPDPHAFPGEPYTGIIRLVFCGNTSCSFAYGPRAGFENQPVANLSFHDAMRFANWLHNGQPVGEQDETTTEDGSYTLTAGALANDSVTRNASARFFVPTEDEWYKAAYYDPSQSLYYFYPIGAFGPASCLPPEEDDGSAMNCAGSFQPPRRTDVGAYALTLSPFGTLDQGGNAWEWTEGTAGNPANPERKLWGGDYASLDSYASSLAGGAYVPFSYPAGTKAAGLRLAAPAEPIRPQRIPACGLGVELALLLPALRWARVRRRAG